MKINGTGQLGANISLLFMFYAYPRRYVQSLDSCEFCLFLIETEERIFAFCFIFG